MRRLLAHVTAACVAAGLISPPASGAQHLVRAGNDWSTLASTWQPGDEVVLMPGEHRSAELVNIRGERGKPITIRSVAPHAPAVIVADQDGLTLVRPAFVVIQDIQIRGASLVGLTIDGCTQPQEKSRSANGDPAATESSGEPWVANVTLRNVVVERVGPQGNRHGIRLNGVRRVDLEDSRVEGWGGAAVEVVGSHDITMVRCQFKGLPDHGQQCGVQMRGGSANVRIEQSRFENAGVYAVLFGGRSLAEEFCPALPGDATAASAFEARSGYIEKSLILGGGNALGFFGCTECLVRNCTIIRPRGSVMVIGHGHPDPRIATARRGIFGSNLVLWKPGDLQALAIVDPAVDADSFVLEPNLWWSPDFDSQREALGPLPGKSAWEQIWDINPELDAGFKPGHPDAASFGCLTP